MVFFLRRISRFRNASRSYVFVLLFLMLNEGLLSGDDYRILKLIVLVYYWFFLVF